jgi:hypothetical protein
MIWARRRVQGDSPAPRERVTVSAVAEAADAARVHGGEALDWLIDRLLAVDEAGDTALAREALGMLQSRPWVVGRLDERARRVWWWSEYYKPVIDGAAERLRDGTAGPIAVALASTHGDGHVRERAVERILAAPDLQSMPFLVLRTADWVKPVRDRARAGLAVLLADEPDKYLPAVLGMTLAVRARRRGGFVHTQAVAALLTAPPSVRDGLLAARDRAQRRFVIDVGVSQRWWSPQELFALAVTEPDVRVRARTAEAVCREAVWSRQIDILRRLARHPRPEVRAVALTGLLRVGHEADVAAHLDDPVSLVRAIARDAARRSGIDALYQYRAVVTAADPAVGAIAGLSETGSQTDAPLLRDLLTHSDPRVRSQAIRALRHLDAVPVEQAIRMLHDLSPSVVREATAALRPLTRAVPADVAWGLLADPDRVELRRAGYRLLRVRGTLEQLRAALLLAIDANPRLARRAVADTTRLARDAASPGWRRLSLPALDATPAQIAELAALVDRASAVLSPDTTQMLHAWLIKSRTRS